MHPTQTQPWSIMASASRVAVSARAAASAGPYLLIFGFFPQAAASRVGLGTPEAFKWSARTWTCSTSSAPSQKRTCHANFSLLRRLTAPPPSAIHKYLVRTTHKHDSFVRASKHITKHTCSYNAAPGKHAWALARDRHKRRPGLFAGLALRLRCALGSPLR